MFIEEFNLLLDTAPEERHVVPVGAKAILKVLTSINIASLRD
jgi:hypothetical protein